MWAAALTLPDDKLHVVFCDVGQGDAILIYRKTTQMLIDGGPNNKVLGCLARHVPFYDRRIETVVLTHPQADHMNGIIDVIKRYNVMRFIGPVVGNETAGYKSLMSNVQSSMINVKNVYGGDEIRLGQVKFDVVWPARGFVIAHTKDKYLTLDLSPRLGEGNQKVLGIGSGGTDLNSFSVGGIVSFGEFDVLLTGDADTQIEDEMIEAGRLREVEVLKVPHHGSKTGMTEEWLRIISPELAVISVGKNSYGHPTKEAIDLLSSNGARVLRTDIDGEVEVVSDGKRWWVK